MASPTLGQHWEAELTALKEGWDSFLARPIASAAVDALKSFHVVPCSDGGLQLEAHRDGFDIEICIGPQGQIEFAMVSRSAQ